MYAIIIPVKLDYFTHHPAPKPWTERKKHLKKKKEREKKERFLEIFWHLQAQLIIRKLLITSVYLTTILYGL